MKLRKQLSLASASLALSGLLLSLSPFAYASTSSSGTVHAEINGIAFPAIAVGNTTYLEWRALTVFDTPNAYLGNGKFAITVGTVQGVVYHGSTYLPWDAVATKVKATPLKGGGFNFTAIPVSHYYQVMVAIQNGTIGNPDPFQVFTFDGSKMVPNQTVELGFDGSSYASGYEGQKSISVTTGPDGTWTGGLNDITPETAVLSTTWTDPLGKQHTGTVSVPFTVQVSTQTSIPVDDTVVATVPFTTFQNGLFFNAQGAGQDIMFQLDTGAYEPLITKQVAQLLSLPNLGNTTVEGIGGQDNAYLSKMGLTIGGHQFTNIPCIVDASYTGPSLFGYGFFEDNGYDLLVSQKHNTITILK